MLNIKMKIQIKNEITSEEYTNYLKEYNDIISISNDRKLIRSPYTILGRQLNVRRWNDKLKRGALNIVSSPVEIARSIQITSNEESLLKGWTVGFVKGFGDGLLRLGAGLADVLTCPFNFPDSNKGPLIQPEYVWEKP